MNDCPQDSDHVPQSASPGQGSDRLRNARSSSALRTGIRERILVAAQLALIMKLVQKSVDQLDEEVEDNLVTTEVVYILSHFLGDGSYFLGVAVDKKTGSLGNMRLMTRQFADDIWGAIPKRKSRR